MKIRWFQLNQWIFIKLCAFPSFLIVFTEKNKYIFNHRYLLSSRCNICVWYMSTLFSGQHQDICNQDLPVSTGFGWWYVLISKVQHKTALKPENIFVSPLSSAESMLNWKCRFCSRNKMAFCLLVQAMEVPWGMRSQGLYNYQWCINVMLIHRWLM